MKTILCAHTDLDGLGCWMVLDYFNIYYDEVLLCDYNRFEDEKEYDSLLNFDKIIMTDYSVSAEIVEKLLKENKEVLIIDHHLNDQTELLQKIKNKNFEYVFNNTKSGTMLCYEYFKPKNVRLKKTMFQFVELVDTYDLFKKEHLLWEEAQNMNRVLYGCLSWNADTAEEKYMFIKDYWFNKINKFNEWSWSEFEQKKIKSAIDKENKQFNESKACFKKFVDDKGVEFGITVAKSKVSIVATRLLEEKKDIKYIIMINNYSGKWDKLSLRSRDKNEFDCNSFKECKGHDCASGGEVKPAFAANLYKGVQNLTYKKD